MPLTNISHQLNSGQSLGFVLFQYPRTSLTERQQITLAEECSNDGFTCGGNYTDKTTGIFRKVFVKLGLTCGDPMETAYYSLKFETAIMEETMAEETQQESQDEYLSTICAYIQCAII